MFGEFLRGASRRGVALVTGSTVTAVLTIFRDALGLPIPRWVYLASTNALFLLGVTELWKSERQARQEAEQREQSTRAQFGPKIELSLSPRPTVRGTLTLYRVNVRNVGGTTIDSVGAALVAIEASPSTLVDFGETPLNPSGRSNLAESPKVSLDPGANQAFDLVAHGEGERILRLQHATHMTPPLLPIANYLFHVRVTGRDMRSSDERFWIRPSGRTIQVAREE